MNIKIPVYLLSVTNVALLIFLFLANNGNTNVPEDQINTVSTELDQLRESINEIKKINISLQEQVSYSPSRENEAKYTVMSNEQVRKLLSEIIKTQQRTNDLATDSQTNKQQTISYEQQIKYDAISQQIDASDNTNTMNFHELMKKENIGNMPEEYRNKILSKLIKKLNNGEIEPNAVLGINKGSE